ncbi:hypothetical protein MK163_11540, partial [bacterium]|nr:hypothetical protein [bacterium]
MTHEITKLQGDARSIGGRCEFEHVIGADGVQKVMQNPYTATAVMVNDENNMNNANKKKEQLMDEAAERTRL